MLGYLGDDEPRILTMIIVRENSEVVIVYPDIYIYDIIYIHVSILPNVFAWGSKHGPLVHQAVGFIDHLKQTDRFAG